MARALSETPAVNGTDSEAQRRTFWPLTLGCMGVVYGDIGTSPLYAFRVALDAAGGSHGDLSRGTVIGVLSMIKYPLGVGGGGFPDVALETYKEYNLQRVFERAREVSVTGILNAGGMYFAELGIVFVFFLAIVLGASMRIEVLHLLYATLAFFFYWRFQIPNRQDENYEERVTVGQFFPGALTRIPEFGSRILVQTFLT